MLAHASKPKCYTAVVNAFIAADLEKIVDDLETIPEAEWKAALAKHKIKIPEMPLVLARWGSDKSRTAYNIYVVKQALGQRIASHFENLSTQFLDSEVGRSLVKEGDISLRENMPQILLSLAASGEIPLATRRSGNPITNTKIGTQSFNKALSTLELESFDINNERVRNWVLGIKGIINNHPALWQALKTRVTSEDTNRAIREIFHQNGFPIYAEHFKHNGWFIDPALAPLTKGKADVLDLSIQDFFASENAACCGTSCGNCPLGFPSILKDVQKNLVARNQAQNIFSQTLLQKVQTVLTEERAAFEASINESFRVLNELGPQSFGIFSDKSPQWIDHFFRKGVLESQVEFLKYNSELIHRHYRMLSNDAPLVLLVQNLLKHPLLKRNQDAHNLRHLLNIN